MTLQLHPGDCYLIEFPPNPKRHLQVIITSVEKNTGNFILVGIESLNKRSDKTTILHPGEHSFILRDSALVYRLADVYDIKWLQEKIDTKKASKKEPVSASILKRICDGLVSSPQTRERVREFYLSLSWKLGNE
jgi:hypothetical protein